MDAEAQTPQRYAQNGIRRVAVFAASSQALANEYLEAAAGVGRSLAQAGMSIVYGGGGTGLMGAMADAALGEGAEVYGVVPRFLMELELSHTALTRLHLVENMRERKHRMLQDADALVTLPGGCGTYEEFFEAMTLKRLGQWTGPIVLVNTNGFYDRLIDFLDHSIRERFMSDTHGTLWSVVSDPGAVVEALGSAQPWDQSALQSALVQT